MVGVYPAAGRFMHRPSMRRLDGTGPELATLRRRQLCPHTPRPQMAGWLDGISVEPQVLLIGPLALIGLAVVPGRLRSRRARAA